MLRLAEKNKVLYVNRPLSILSPFSGNEEVSSRSQFFESFRQPHEVIPNLFVASPLFGFPLRYSLISEIINSKALLSWLRKKMLHLNMYDPIIWTYLPDTMRVVKNLPKSLSIYHCVDDYSEYEHWWNRRSWVQARERKLVETVDLVVTTSRNLQKKRAQINSNVYFVPNAADFELFSKALNPETRIPPDLTALPKPRIGYVGMFGRDHIDIDWIEYAARRSGYSFVFIGRKCSSSYDLSRLERCKNLHFLGFREQSQLPAYLKGMDVCLIPYVKCERIEAVFPLKLFEYLAAGKPVVARKTEELNSYKNLISLAETPDEFLEAIKLSLRENTGKHISLRVCAAKKNTWDDRVESLSSIVKEARKR